MFLVPIQSQEADEHVPTLALESIVRMYALQTSEWVMDAEENNFDKIIQFSSKHQTSYSVLSLVPSNQSKTLVMSLTSHNITLSNYNVRQTESVSGPAIVLFEHAD